MGTTLSTLSNLAIYIGLVVVGAFLGSRKALRSRPLVWVGQKWEIFFIGRKNLFTL